ncbi:MAG: glycosyltransferase family 4 protein [Fimbriimonadaceae bacterium]|nr:glycosyltransferase family 4 protein [Alphaproteobacteria bacterium]
MTIFESQTTLYLSYALAAFILNFAATRAYIWLNDRHLKAYDKPNERGVHANETTIGGGLPLLVNLVFLWLTIWPSKPVILTVLVATIVLGIVSWIDDLKNLRQLYRLAMQFLIIAAILFQLEQDARVFGGVISFVPDRLLTAFCWIWFINLFNFMDGIDGLAGAETIAICAGLLAIGYVVQPAPDTNLPAVLIAGVTAGFLYWNWHPAKLFLGDVGSVPLGFLLGWLLINLALSGYLAAAFILPLYFLGDATTTMMKRLVRGEAIWEPHRQHFYQQAVLKGWPHSTVVKRISLANLLLIGLAVYSVNQPVVAAIIALTVVFLLFYVLARMAQTMPPQ